MPDKPQHRHAGHRQRVKTEFLTRGLEGWPEHRVLEIMLFYAIPQGDVNALAHALIDRFGSLAGVLDASVDLLCQVPGVGEHTAALLKLFPAVAGRYVASRSSLEDMATTSDQVRRILAPYFFGARNEMTYLLCLDGKHKALGVRKLGEGSIHTAEITARRLTEEALALRAAGVILAHNHISGLAIPSAEDRNTTLYLKGVLEPIGIELVDHVIFCDDDMVSMRDSRML